MPSNLNPLGALPSRFRRQRVLIVGCGDVGLRVARQLPRNVRLMALTSSAERVRHISPLGEDVSDPGGTLIARYRRARDKMAALMPEIVERVMAES